MCVLRSLCKIAHASRTMGRWRRMPPPGHVEATRMFAARHCSSLGLTATGVSISSIQHGASQTSSPPPPPAAAAAAATTTTMTIRGRVEALRVRGKQAFMHLRQPPFHSIQVVVSGADLARQVKGLTPESIVDVSGAIVRTERPVTSVSCTDYELHAERIDIVSKAATPLPFPLRDGHTKLETRLNHRVIDMRTPLMASMLRIVSAVSQSFRAQLLARDFVEIHTPKLIGSASEGGSAVFALDYFGQPGYLAQSPQIYKQMALMGDAMRAFEIGPVFRAENSLTHRHLTEFVGLDAELVIGHSYTEVLDVLEAVVCGVIRCIQTEHMALVQQAQASLAEATVADGSAVVCEVSDETIAALQLAAVDDEGVVSQDRYQGRVGGKRPKVLRLAFNDAVQLLFDDHQQHHRRGDELLQPMTDFSLPQERRLGELVRARYGVDLYIVDQFPAPARPFYTMPHPSRAGATCSFDLYLRGEEICSGAQRIHDPAALLQNMERLQVDPTRMKAYLDSFRYGAWPHGGFGLGLERIVLFLLGARDIRQVSLFPRDPKRLAP